MRTTILLALLAAPALVACGDPVIDAKIEALGDEIPGVAPGEHHRPGQPCLVCHGAYKGITPKMSVAGTIFSTPSRGTNEPVPVEGVIVTVTDSFGDVKTKTTNCIGNFYITEDEWLPGFPLAAKIEYPTPSGGTSPVYMSTRIGRDGSCASCHQGNIGPSSPGLIYCVDQPTDPFPPPDDSCPGVAP